MLSWWRPGVAGAGNPLLCCRPCRTRSHATARIDARTRSSPWSVARALRTWRTRQDPRERGFGAPMVAWSC